MTLTTPQLAALIDRLAAERHAAIDAADWGSLAALDRQLRRYRLVLLQQRHAEVQESASFARLVRAYRHPRRRCLHCGGTVTRAALCDACRRTLAYCPACKTCYARRASLDPRYAVAYCKTCNTAHWRKKYAKRPVASARAHLAGVLPGVIELYRQGATFAAIGQALGLPHKRIAWLIYDARRHGEWPEELRRITRQNTSSTPRERGEGS